MSPGIPSEFLHFFISEHLGSVSPLEVLEWPDDMVEDALLYIRASSAAATARRVLKN